MCYYSLIYYLVSIGGQTRLLARRLPRSSFGSGKSSRIASACEGVELVDEDTVVDVLGYRGHLSVEHPHPLHHQHLSSLRSRDV